MPSGHNGLAIASQRGLFDLDGHRAGPEAMKGYKLGGRD